MAYCSFAERTIQSPPTLLLYQGEFLKDNMIKERVTKAEVYAALRSEGYKQKEEVYAVVLESNARISVLGKGEEEAIGATLDGVNGLPDDLQEEFRNKN